MDLWIVQHDVSWNRPAETLARLGRLLDDAPMEGGLILLPETFSTGFVMDAAAAEGDGGSAGSFLTDLARRTGSHVLAGVLRVGRDGRAANEAVLHAPDGREVLAYRKRRLFTPAREHEHFAAGEDAALAEVGGMTLSPLICYDLRFPELFRQAVGAGAELLAVVANWPASRMAHWRALLVARAIENQAFVVGVNRVGSDSLARYAGGSLVVGPDGQVLAEAGDGEQILPAQLDVSAVRTLRRTFPALRDAGLAD